MACVFCKIVKWETASQRVYEDHKYIAFLDINPVNFGHTLIIPRAHHTNLEDTPGEVLGEMMALVKKIGPAIVKAMKADAYNIILNNGSAAGQVIDHIHFHVIPRYLGDGAVSAHGRNRYPEGQMGETAKMVKLELGSMRSE